MLKRSCRPLTKRTFHPASKAIVLPPSVDLELMEIENIIRLAAFAAEARRILNGMDSVMQHFPEVKQHINQMVDYSGMWSCHEETTASVLADVAHRLSKLVNKV